MKFSVNVYNVGKFGIIYLQRLVNWERSVVTLIKIVLEQQPVVEIH